MRSNSASTLVSLVLLALGAVGVAWLREPLAARFHSVKARSNVYTLPSAEQTVALSLGYRSALADLIYAHVLVSYGLHFQEKRRFEYVGNYLDTINALDPRFETPYRFADTLLTLQPKPARYRDYKKARQILERGMRELPYDAELWTSAGQFLAYLAPPHLPAKVRVAWRRAGARRLAHACELIGKNENLPYHCITAAAILSRQGARQATIEFLERVLAVADDEQIRKLALGYLKRAIGEQVQSKAEARLQRFHKAWHADLGFVHKDMLLVLGPHFEAASCAGLARAGKQECATTWRAWAAASDSRY